MFVWMSDLLTNSIKKQLFKEIIQAWNDNFKMYGNILPTYITYFMKPP